MARLRSPLEFGLRHSTCYHHGWVHAHAWALADTAEDQPRSLINVRRKETRFPYRPAVEFSPVWPHAWALST
nr:hypothetical protein CFP56_02833 [Quercus suber]